MEMLKCEIAKKYVGYLSIIANIVLLIILFTPLTEQLYKPLIVDEPAVPGDVIVVLSSGGYTHGFPGFRTITRLLKALELYRQYPSRKILCSGGFRLKKADKTIAQVMKETLILYGIPGDDILVQDDTTNTYLDITALLERFREEFDFNNALFVTSSYHTYRVKKILLKKGVNAVVISANPWELYPSAWSERIDLFREIIREYGAICFFKLRGYL